MAILKANNSILKANGKILKAANRLADLLYYTRFETIDSNFIDTPLVGERVDYKGTRIEGLYLNNFLPSDNKFLHWQQDFQQTIKTDIVNLGEDGLEQITIEYFLIGKGATDFGSGLDIYLNNKNIMQDNFNALTNRYLRISGMANLNVQTFNGCQVISQWGYRCIVPLDLCPNNSIFHRAIVIKKDNTQWHYVNGKLAVINTLTREVKNVVQIGRFTGRSELWVSHSNFAIWSKDRSINGGMEYPVPTKPYF